METLLASIGFLLAAIFLFDVFQSLTRERDSCLATGIGVVAVLFGAAGILLLFAGLLL